MSEVYGTIRHVSKLDRGVCERIDTMLDAWENADRSALVDLDDGPLAHLRDCLVVVEQLDASTFRYLHYGDTVRDASGFCLKGKRTDALEGSVAAFFVRSYTFALDANRPARSFNRARLAHVAHTWDRLLLPSAGRDGKPNHVVALVQPIAHVGEVLAHFTRDIGFLGGTLGEIVDDDEVRDFVLLPLADPRVVFPQVAMDRLSDLYGRQLTGTEIEMIMAAADGEIAINTELPRSLERFGRRFVLQVSGGSKQPIFSIADATELVEARLVAEDRKKAMEDFAETGSDWMWETDANHIMTMLTAAVAKTTGHGPSHYVGKDRFGFADLPDNRTVFKAHRKDLEARRPFRDLTYRIKAADGSDRWLCVAGKPVFADDGRFLGYRGTGSDITAEVEARRALEAQKVAMEDFAKAGSDWMWETGPDHRITMIRGPVEEKSGYPPEHYIGKCRMDLAFLAENAGRFDVHERDLNARRAFDNFVYCSIAKDGGRRWSSISGRPRFGDDGSFLGYRGTGMNVTAEIEARRELEAQKVAMEDFANTASDWLWEVDADQVFTFMSPAIETFTGLPNSYYLGRSRLDLIGDSSNADVLAAHHADIAARRPFNDFVYRVPLSDGRVMWARSNGKPRFGEDGTYLGYRGTGTNITNEVEAREQAARRAQELADAHRLGRMGGWSFDRVTGGVSLSPEVCELLGLPDGQAGHGLDALLPRMDEDMRRKLRAGFRALLRGRNEIYADAVWARSISERMELSVIAKARRGSDGRLTHIVGTVQDITQRKTAERELQALAFHDPLTGLGNRAYFSRELSELLNRTARGDLLGGLLLLDLDHFKEINDSLGHAAGDEMLRRVAERLSIAIGAAGRVFRLGGDEFAVIVPEVASAAVLASHAQEIAAALKGTVRLNEGAVQVSTSIGMVVMPTQSQDADETMRFADLALYEAKGEGRNCFKLFDESMDQNVRDRVSLARDLREAIKNDALNAHFQMQVNVMEGAVVGFEGLARWNHPTRGPIPPSRFIPIAESSRLIADLGAWMIETVCRQGRAWLDAGGAPLQMAVNLSVAQLWHRDVEADIRNALDGTGFPPELLCVELTESVFSEDALPRIQRLFVSLKAIGVNIALDDFGTGFSSLQYLNRLSFDRLKIDRSFVQNCQSSREQRRLLQGIVGLGHGLGLTVVVEGVETQDELQVVCDLGCDVVQGFYFSRPKAFHDACLDAAQVEADLGLKPMFWKSKPSIDGRGAFSSDVHRRIAAFARRRKAS